MSSRYKNLLKDTFIFSLGNLGTKLILFLMVPLYTNYMSKPDYGTADLVFTISQLMAPFISVVIFDAVIRFGLSKDEKKENVILVGLIVLCISTVLGLLLTPIIGLYKTIYEWKWYLYFYVIFNIAGSIEYSYLKAKGRNKSYSLLSIVQTGLMATLNVYFLVTKSMGIRGYLLAYIISNFIIDVLLFFAADIGSDVRKAEFDKDLFKRMVLYSTPCILNNISWWVIHSSDKMMVEVMVSTSALGIYTAAAKIPALINVIVSIFQQAWGISAVKEYETSNDKEYYSTVFTYLFLIISGACIFFVSIIKIFMTHYVGKDFLEAWQYVPLLLVSAVYAGVAAYFGAMYSALKKSINNMVSTSIAALVNIVVNWVLIPFIGICGAVIGTVIAYIVLAFVRIFDVIRFVEIDIKWRSFILTMFIIITQAILVSMNFYIILTSIVSIFLYLIINANELQNLYSWLKNAIVRK